MYAGIHGSTFFYSPLTRQAKMCDINVLCLHFTHLRLDSVIVSLAKVSWQRPKLIRNVVYRHFSCRCPAEPESSEAVCAKRDPVMCCLLAQINTISFTCKLVMSVGGFTLRGTPKCI